MPDPVMVVGKNRLPMNGNPPVEMRYLRFHLCGDRSMSAFLSFLYTRIFVQRARSLFVQRLHVQHLFVHLLYRRHPARSRPLPRLQVTTAEDQPPEIGRHC